MSSMVVDRDRQLEAKFIGSGRCLRRAGAQGGKGTCGPGIRRALGAAHSIPAFPFAPRRLPTRAYVSCFFRAATSCLALPRFLAMSPNSLSLICVCFLEILFYLYRCTQHYIESLYNHQNLFEKIKEIRKIYKIPSNFLWANFIYFNCRIFCKINIFCCKILCDLNVIKIYNVNISSKV